MSEFPLVTLIVPIYNAAPYILRCLSSIEKQDYPNLEVLLIDDCSQDRTREIILEFISDSDRFILLSHEHNKGANMARNTGLNNAKGEYIAFLDSDDWVEHDYISSMIFAARKNRMQVAACGYDHVYDGGKAESKDAFGCLTTETSFREKIALLSVSVTRRVFARELFSETGISFPETLRRADDIAVGLPLTSYANDVAIVNRPLYHYYQRSDSISNTNTAHMDYSFMDASIDLMCKRMKPGYELEAQSHAIMELLYSKPMLQLSVGFGFRRVAQESELFTNRNPNWRLNPYMSRFPLPKRLFISAIGKQQILFAWGMLKAWKMMQLFRGMRK